MTDNYDGDPRIIIDENGADISYSDGQPEMDAGVKNNDIIALFTEPGWPGNTLLDNGQRIGSDFEQLATGSITLSKLADVEDAARRALVSPVANTDSVEVTVTNPSGVSLNVSIKRSPPGQDVGELMLTRHGLNWINQAKSHDVIPAPVKQIDPPPPITDFITTWRTTGASESITLPAIGVNAFTVDWGDGTAPEVVTTPSPSHVYAIAGDHDVSVSGSCTRWSQNAAGDKLKIIDVKQWGDVGFTNLSEAFNECFNLVITATDAGSFGLVTNMTLMFRAATVANPNTSGWDVSSVTNMSNMFQAALSANPDTSGWDVSAVTTTTGMFSGASVANPDVSGWDVSSVADMSGMFNGAALSDTNYDLLLAAWSLLTLQSAVPFHAGTAKYTEVAARLVLTSTYLWTITDGGPA